MKEHQEQNHVCKFCKKSFLCGRSLGGHMRSHMTMNSAETEEKLSKRKVSSASGGSSSNSYMGFESGGHSSYGLRENPKKTWRLSDSSNGNLWQEKVCKECGKGFQSWKALFGHMRCHSERDRISNTIEDDSGTSSNQKLVMDSQSVNEAAAPRRRQRSRRTRYKTNKTSFSFAIASTSVSKIEQEQEEVAMCLMMLSKDVGHWGGLNSSRESSDNNSLVLEARSSCLDKQITKKEGKIFVLNGGETVKIKKPIDKKLEYRLSDSDNVRFEMERSDFAVSGSEFLRDDVKKVELEVSVDGFLRDDELKNPKLDHESGFEASNAELEKDLCNENKVKCTEAELGKDLIKEIGFNHDDLGSRKYNSSKRTRSDAYYPELGGNTFKLIKYDASDSEICKDAHKKSKFECTTCNKIFHSYQALGGHRASHKKIGGCFASKIESSENSIETNISPEPTADSKYIKSCIIKNPIDQDVGGNAEKCKGSKNSKGHECPFCRKVFASGQALGGHKRSHLVGGSDARGNQTIVIQKQLPVIRDLLDLNLPAPMEEETNVHVGFKPCWVGSNCNHEPLTEGYAVLRKWAEMQQYPPNPNPSTDPYAQLYEAQPSNPYYPHQPQNPNPNPSHGFPSVHYVAGLEAALRPPGIDAYATLSSYPPNHVGYDGQAAVAYGHQPVQAGALAAAAYYQDSSAAAQNWDVKEAIRQFGVDPVGYAIVSVLVSLRISLISVGIWGFTMLELSAGTRPPNGTVSLVAANPNPIFYTNPPFRSHGNGTWRRGPKKTKIVQSAWCEICKIDCNSKDVLDQHKLGKKHNKNLEKIEESKKGANATVSTATPVALTIGPVENPAVQQMKRKVAPPVPEEDLETKRRKLLEGGAAAEAVRACAICNVVCNSDVVFNYHLAGQKHAAMVKKHAAGTGTAA
ncbi:hypothetical protein HHK36_007325 [Tetracentron sinense]|uniref:C2H2-type domain-containing protein n=1 Tax=Tetracentron sinense TaxID=13715 RepID=A0A835DL56_TETSI|nr:hypothetical protein HHK36_007325 [Tetracentron sinense]